MNQWHPVFAQHLVFLVSSIDLPVEADSLPLHIVGREPFATERQVAEFVVEQPELQKRYGGWLANLHPTAWKEIETMAKAAGKKLLFDIRPAIESLGLDCVIEQIGIDRVIEQIGLERFLDGLSPAERREVIQRIGLDNLLACLSPAERRELKQRL